MTLLQVACFAIVVGWLVIRGSREQDVDGFVRRFFTVALAAWISEDSCIRLYGFYGYAPSWWGFIDQVPIAIVCIWPVVIMSSMDIVRSLTKSRVQFAVGVMLMVLTDAVVIEPISVASGLWSWTEPGPFQVPLIGVLGWGLFALGAALVDARPITVITAPLVTHGLLLAAWWGGLRWVPHGEGDLPFVVAMWIASFSVLALIVLRKVQLPRADLLLRVPAALFFFVLLAVYARDNVLLVAFACASAPPYLLLTMTSRWTSSPSTDSAARDSAAS